MLLPWMTSPKHAKRIILSADDRIAATEALAMGYRLAYWTQMVVVFCFLVLLPIGEHFHIVTALPALFLR